MTERKIAFFDIDGTLTSEIDGSIPSSVYTSIEKARKQGNLMFINTGRCFQNVEKRFRDIGFDGYVCGCGTHVLCNDTEIMYHTQSHLITMEILHAARQARVDLLFESRDLLAFDLTRDLTHPDAQRHYRNFLKLGYDMPTDFEAPDFHCDKFVIWYRDEKQLTQFRKTSDLYFDCIDRGGTFREFVPHGYTKATGIQTVLRYYHMDENNVYAFGDSNNDLAMLQNVKNSVAMGNSSPTTLFDYVSYVTDKASQNGIQKALEHFHFL